MDNQRWLILCVGFPFRVMRRFFKRDSVDYRCDHDFEGSWGTIGDIPYYLLSEFV